MKDHHLTAVFALVSVLFWAVAMLACAILFKGCDGYVTAQYILGGVAAIHFIIIWGPLGLRAAKKYRH